MLHTNIYAQGESCANPVVFDCSVEDVKVSGSTGTGGTTGCSESTDGTWFQIDLQADQTAINFQFNAFDCTGGGCKPNYALYDACGGTIEDSDCSVSTNSSYTVSGLTAGGTYYLFVNGNKNTFNSATIQLNTPTSYNPAGASDSNPITLTSGSTLSGGLCATDGTSTFTTNTCGVSYDYEQWYEITIPSGNCYDIDIDITNYTGSGDLSFEVLNYCNANATYYNQGNDCSSSTTASASVSGIYNGTTAITYFVLVSSTTNDGTFDISYTSSSSPINGADGSECSSAYRLTSGDGIGANFGDALTTSNHCAGVGSEDGTVETSCISGSEFVPNTSNIFSDNTTCSASLENTQYFEFVAPTTDMYNIFIGNQSCDIGNGIQFFITDNMNCNTSPATVGSILGCSSTSSLSNQELTGLSLTAGTTYYIVTDGFAGDICTYDILVTTSSSPVPIELKDFKVREEKNKNIISWSTYTEVGNEFQIIEKSLTGKDDWKEVGRVSGKNNTDINQYSVEDMQPNLTSYYRIKAIDFDGYMEYSHIIHLKRINTNSKWIEKFYPNPVTNSLILAVGNQDALSESVNFEIYDITGTRVLEKNSVKIDNQSIIVDTGSLRRGVYLVKIGNKSYTETYKFSKI